MKDEAASKETKKTLQSMKLHPRETYEEVIERMIEDLSELNEETIFPFLSFIKHDEYHSYKLPHG